MKIPYFAWPYRVETAVPGWKGWRLTTWYAGQYKCGCLECPCCDGTFHWTRWSISRPLFFPRRSAL